MRRCDFVSVRADSRESMGAVAATHARHAPERVRDDSHAGAGRTLRIERLLVVVAHAGHDDSAACARSHAQRRDEVGRRAGSAAEAGEGSVYDEHAVAAHSEGNELVGDSFRETHVGGSRSAHMLIFALNCGSSSLKCAAIDTDRRSHVLDVRVEDWSSQALSATALRRQSAPPDAIVHRIVHGGERFLQRDADR